mmetsp:Transcript_32810/g.84730  ORF Transcript_32810/g.84730 Transcript_32810/m.84730 type:complete len:89 (+) Transcript_32810:445-711(+)
MKMPDMSNFSFSDPSKYGFEANMTRDEAAQILGVKKYSKKPEVMQAYKTLMRMNHPDTGGSPYIAAKVNEAKDLLVTGKNASGSNRNW